MVRDMFAASCYAAASNISGDDRQMVRQNDGGWSFSIADGNSFTIDADVRAGNWVGGRGAAVGLTNSSNAFLFDFGSHDGGNQWRMHTGGGAVDNIVINITMIP